MYFNSLHMEEAPRIEMHPAREAILHVLHDDVSICSKCTYHNGVHISNFSCLNNVSLSRATLWPLGHINEFLDMTSIASGLGVPPWMKGTWVGFCSLTQSQANMLDNQHRNLARRIQRLASVATQRPLINCVLALIYPKPALSALRLA